MTLVVDEGRNGPRIHALIVGVGFYQHLQDGTDPRPDFDNWGIGQLTSTVVSARAFADWVLDEMDHPAAQLGTVRMLLSPAQQYQNAKRNIDMAIDGASMDNLENAFQDWLDDCDRDEDNICLFFFAGHGAGNYPLCLLPEDFGERPRQLLQNTMNFDRTHEAMRTTCRARTICFFADTCRPLNFKVLASSSPGKILADEDQSKAGAPNSPRFFATAGNASAYGRTNQISFYTEALLMALRGLASRRYHGRWEIMTDRLHTGIREAMNHVKRDNGVPNQVSEQKGNPGSTLLHVLDDPPLLPVEIELVPTAAYDGSPKLEVKHGPAEQMLESEVAVSSPWQIILPAGGHTGVASFPNNEYPTSQHITTVTPSTLYLEWDVEHPDG